MILTRRVGESILIDNPVGAIDCTAESITVTVLGVKDSQIRIGIDAPDDITILHEEPIPDMESA